MADGTIVKPGLSESCADTCCRSTSSALSLTSERTALIRRAFRREWMTVAWMVVEGVVAIAAGLATGSLTLLAFGLDSAIELASAGVLIWRLNVELRHGKGFSERAERTASRIPVKELIQRMVTAHAATMNGVGEWNFTATATEAGAILTVVTPSKDTEKLRGLGFIGVMTHGMHHQEHHLMIARGNNPHH